MEFVPSRRFAIMCHLVYMQYARHTCNSTVAVIINGRLLARNTPTIIPNVFTSSSCCRFLRVDEVVLGRDVDVVGFAFVFPCKFLTFDLCVFATLKIL